MSSIRLILGGKRQLDLTPIPPGEAASVVVDFGEASDIRLVYQQPDGVTNDLMHLGFPQGREFWREDKVVLCIMSNMTKGNPSSMRGYIQRRQRWDPALYVPFAPGAGD